MKNKLKISIIALSMALLLFSCNDMDMEQGLGIDDKLMWSNPTYINNYVVDMISYMPNGFSPVELGSGILYAGATDEAENANPALGIHIFNSGNLSPVWTSIVWERNYTGIYKANLFLEKLKHVDFTEYAPDKQSLFMADIAKYKAEARMLRALCYYELIKHFGGVVLLGDAFVENINDLSKPEFSKGRSSLTECANYIVGECDTIIDKQLLPLLDQGADQGRPNGTAAKALKCKTLLLMASPVYNSNITEGSSAQKAIWEKVLAVSQDICFNRIFSFGAYDVYDGTSPEVILGYRQKNSNFLEKANFPAGAEGVDINGSTNPTQNLVDAYRMLNGNKISESGSGYDPTNPYTGRDKRLAQTVIYNGYAWKERNTQDRTVEIFRGGRDGMDRDNGTKTGYYIRKFIDPKLDLRQGQGSNREWPIFRFSDIALIWAEAANELYGPAENGNSFLTATTILNQTITRHGGLPELPLSGITQTELRERIREERFVELAFEDQRAWDLRRWGIAHQVLSQPVYKMEVTRNENGTINYTKAKLEDRYFSQRMMLYPIPQRDVNNGLTQNSGW